MLTILTKALLKMDSPIQNADDFLYATNIAEISLFQSTKRFVLENIQKAAVALAILSIVALTVVIGVIKANAEVNLTPKTGVHDAIPVVKIHIK